MKQLEEQNARLKEALVRWAEGARRCLRSWVCSS